MRARFLSTFVAAAVAACAQTGGTETHPDELTGTWARLLPDGRWGDTMQFRPDGALGGSETYKVPPGLTWRVEPQASGGPQFCATLGNDGFCRPFELRGDTLVLIGGPGGRTIFRRVD